MGQSRLESLIEVLANIAIGFLVTMLASPIIYPWFGVTFTVAQNFGLTLIFTVLSVVRGYIVRRWFNNNMKNFSKRVAELVIQFKNQLTKEWKQ